MRGKGASPLQWPVLPERKGWDQEDTSRSPLLPILPHLNPLPLGEDFKMYNRPPQNVGVLDRACIRTWVLLSERSALAVVAADAFVADFDFTSCGNHYRRDLVATRQAFHLDPLVGFL